MKTLLLILILAISAFAQQSNDALLLGNPSDAKTKITDANNYLVEHTGYSLSYNKSRGAANWVAWHLTKTDVGTVDRSNAFAPDTTGLPAADWWIKPNDYTGSGYDRGHMCPSKDRSASEEANRETFLMDNMQPQAPKLNQKTWKYLEDYERELTKQGNEEYIYAGCYGDKGRIADKITIPARCYKIIVVLPEGEYDLKRIDKTTRVIAVDMPNDETVSQRWRTYLTTVDDIEEKTGYDFLSKLPKKTQKEIESAKDAMSDGADNNNSEDTPTSAKDDKKPDGKDAADVKAQPRKVKKGDREYLTGARGGCYYLTESGKKQYVKPEFCEGNTMTEAKPTTQPKEEPAEEEKSADKKTAEKSESKPSAKNSEPKTKTNKDGRTYITGSRGGCYYLDESGKKVYVKDKSLCSQ